jgi:hypothetical protein
MIWRRLFKREAGDQPEHPNLFEQPQPTPRVPDRKPADPGDPAVRAQRRQRIERRVRDLGYDIALAESALAAENRWSTRVAEINQAIEQARRDLELAQEPEVRQAIPLPPWPVTVDSVQPARPAAVRFQVGDVPFHYAEELDWAERGHQLAEPQLGRSRGDLASMIPPDVPADRRDELEAHLAHSLNAYAERLREDAATGKPALSLTLADLAAPCPVCGGWRDFLGRCLACQRREWQAQTIRDDVNRLLDERDSQLEEARRWRESLPVLRRQLADAEAELTKYQ